jgi:conjugative relaxase-like TrwC/TraI family protein
MLSLQPIKQAGQAAQYFAKDNYYTEGEGLEKSEWFGKEADRLGLKGQVGKEDFYALLQGEVEGVKLGNSDRRPGTDLTFSAPKSVSIFSEVLGIQSVRQAHETAVKKALSYVEDSLVYTRQTKEGMTEEVQIKKAVFALFRHNTSRDLDPQTHTHALLMNLGKRDDGEWRSIVNDHIYKNRSVIGAIYNSELASELQKQGFELRRTDERGNFEIASVTKEQISEFSSRRKEVLAWLAEKGIDASKATLKEAERAALSTRAAKKDVDHKALIHDWKSRAQSAGIQITQPSQVLGREAGGGGANAGRQFGGEGADSSTRKITGRKALEFAAAHLFEREMVVKKVDLLATALEHGAGRVAASEVLAAVRQAEKNGDLIEIGRDEYGARKTLASERWVLDHIREEAGKTQRILQSGDVEQRVQSLGQSQGIKFSQGQKDAIVLALSSEDRFVAVQGVAGSGKTTMLRAVNTLATDSGWVVRGMAPTGAAAKVMSKEIGVETDTVSMFLIKERQLEKDIHFAQQYAENFHRRKELWLVDEGSFLSQRQAGLLVSMAEKANAKVVFLGDSAQLQAVEAGKPFELAQKDGIATAYMTEINRQKTDELIKAVDIIVGRDAVAPGERLTTVQLKSNAKAFDYMDQAGMVKQSKEEELVSKLVDDLLSRASQERANTIVVTPFNKDRVAINETMREGLKKIGALDLVDTKASILESKGWTRAKIKEAQYYKAGDVVRFNKSYRSIDANKGEYAKVRSVEGGVVTLAKANGTTIAWEPHRNNQVEVYDTESRLIAKGDRVRITRSDGEIKNGQVGTVVELKDGVALVSFQGDSKATFKMDLNTQQHWDHAYASTVHAAQGATAKRAVFLIKADSVSKNQGGHDGVDQIARVFGNRSFYVGATRETHALEIYTDDKNAARQAVAQTQDKSSSVERLDGLGQQRSREHAA